MDNLDSVVQFHALDPAEFPTRSARPIVIGNERGGTDWLVSTDDIDPRLIAPLSAVGSAGAALCPLVTGTPRREPWGELRVEPKDIGINEMNRWEVSENGLYFPVPRDLIRAELAAAMSAIGTDQLRYFDPPR
ncbi:hypothetical protein [Streptosporangium sp. CA-115845]|uniref:hypothetical protein n=1 Tax=Streptosporangium sp. CA-115845 TaxID=3240071 RepID=UPI003D8C9CCA